RKNTMSTLSADLKAKINELQLALHREGITSIRIEGGAVKISLEPPQPEAFCETFVPPVEVTPALPESVPTVAPQPREGDRHGNFVYLGGHGWTDLAQRAQWEAELNAPRNPIVPLPATQEGERRGGFIFVDGTWFPAGAIA